MAMSVKASRFSLLPDDDDDLNKKKLLNKVKKNTGQENKSSTNENNVDANAKKNKNKKKKKKVETDDKDLQALAYGKKVDQNNLKRERASSSSEVNDEDFAKWVSRDEIVRSNQLLSITQFSYLLYIFFTYNLLFLQMNDETFAKDLQAAILASKIENIQQQQAIHQKLLEDTKKQSKKPFPMSLQDFNKMDLNGGGGGDISQQPPEQECDNVKETFFEDVEEASKIAFNREQTRESLQQRYSVSLRQNNKNQVLCYFRISSFKFKFQQVSTQEYYAYAKAQTFHIKLQDNLPDQALVKQYKSILHAKDEEIAQLMEQTQNLIMERDKFKKRNKQYRDLLSQVESRDKAEVISENMKLKHVQGEIALELATLREENEKIKTKLADKDKDLLKLKVNT